MIQVAHVCTASCRPNVTDEAGTKDPIWAMQTMRAWHQRNLVMQAVYSPLRGRRSFYLASQRVFPDLIKPKQLTSHVRSSDDFGCAILVREVDIERHICLIAQHLDLP